MRSARQEIVTRIIDSGSRLAGEPVSDVLENLSGLANDLRQAGVKAGNVVVLEDLQSRDLLAAILLVWQFDAIPMLCQKRPDLPLTNTSFFIDRNFVAHAPEIDAPVHGLETTALLHVSSGTTDKPKIVKRGVASVLAEAVAYRVRLPMTPQDHVIVPIPVVHSYGSGFALSALINGCRLDPEPVVRVSRLARKIDTGTSAVLALTAPLARLLADTDGTGTTGLRVAMVGAGQVSAGLAEAFAARFGVSLARNYGSSETGAIFMGEQGMGEPIPGIEIVHPARGEVGELQIRSAAPSKAMWETRNPGTSVVYR
ncbi:hypothetical protein Srufu_020090 [Streptomyces libani subsp. rufus]|nr:hypothetical protein Srufu_020090 [Streptomyces libani subsp. rufus]